MNNSPIKNTAPTQEDFSHFQKEHFEEAERLRYQWQTSNPLIKKYEEDLLTELDTLLASAARVLEVGCGEGANLVNLPTKRKLELAVGVDFSEEKSNFWFNSTKQAGVAKNCGGLCADATALPLVSASFDLVFCRDLLHHVPSAKQPAVLAEMFRVCRPGGRVVLIESNGRNPIILLHALLIKAERGELKSSPRLFRRLLLDAGGKNLQIKGREPLPVFRLALHYRFGLPALANQKWVSQVFEGTNKLLGWLLPVSYWAYVVAWADVPILSQEKD